MIATPFTPIEATSWPARRVLDHANGLVASDRPVLQRARVAPKWTPTTCPSAVTIGPPEDPGLVFASCSMLFSTHAQFSSSSPCARETMPRVNVNSGSPRGNPAA